MSNRHTLVHQLADWAEKRPHDKAVFSKAPGGGWKAWTWADHYKSVRRIAKGLIALGHAVNEGVVVIGANRPEWVQAELAIMAAGGLAAPIYPTSTPEQLSHIVNNCGAKIAIIDGPELLDKFLACQQNGDIKVEHFITMDEVSGKGENVQSFDALMAKGDGVDDGQLDSRMTALKHEGIGLLIYTSGTTGVPKGAQLTHRGLTMIAQSVLKDYDVLSGTPQRLVSYLPLSHVAEQIFTNMLVLAIGGQVYFCPDLKQVKDYLIEVKPTVFLAVPRVWEKFEAALRARMSEATGIKAKLAQWAMQTEADAFKKTVQSGKVVESFQRNLANKLVISKVKTALGLDELILAVSGAAPIAQGTLDFFSSLGIPIHEGYGMTETTGVATAQPYGQPRFGTVGKAIPGVEIKIAEEDGEILLKGDNMTKGYFKMPEASDELYTDGWMHTGDIGVLNDGFLKITGRKKDLLITAGGKNIAPAEIETLMSGIPGVGQVVVVGDRQPYLSALVALDPDGLEALQKAAGTGASTIEALSQDAAVKALIQKHVDEKCNAKLARYQTIKKFEILPNAFSIDGGEMTPSLKVKRNVVNEKYKSIIEKIYA